MQIFIEIMGMLGVFLGFGLIGLGMIILLSAPFDNIGNIKGFAGQMLAGGGVTIVGMILVSII